MAKRFSTLTKCYRLPTHYLMRDIKKCGITFPHEIIRVMKEELKLKYPESDFDLLGAFENIRYFLEDGT